MNRVPIWFDRKFTFTFPVDLYPNLFARLRGTPERLEAIVRGVSRDVLVRQPDGKWSAQEHAGHLGDLEPLWLTRVKEFLSDSATLTHADVTNRKTHDANHNARSLDRIVAEFRTARAQLMNQVEAIDPALLTRTLLHPRLKQPMRLVDHLFFAAEHDDHHLACIWELLDVGSDSGGRSPSAGAVESGLALGEHQGS